MNISRLTNHILKVLIFGECSFFYVNNLKLIKSILLTEDNKFLLTAESINIKIHLNCIFII